MTLGRYVIVDDSGSYVTFLNVRVKFKKNNNNNSSQRELELPVFQSDRFVQPSNAIDLRHAMLKKKDFARLTSHPVRG